MMMITVCFVPIDEFWVDIFSFLASFGSVHFLSQDPNQVVLEELETVQRLFKNWCCCYRKMVIISITIIACHCIFWGGEDSFKFCGTVYLYMELWGGICHQWGGRGDVTRLCHADLWLWSKFMIIRHHNQLDENWDTLLLFGLNYWQNWKLEFTQYLPLCDNWNRTHS